MMTEREAWTDSVDTKAALEVATRISRNDWYDSPNRIDLEAAAMLRSLVAERDALSVDAERYRWLRTAGAWESEVGLTMLSEDTAEFDAAVDRARKSAA